MKTEFTDNSVAVRQAIQKKLVAGMNNANEFLIDEARAGAPVKSGNLRDNTEVVHEASEGNPVAIGASKMPYAAVVNRGDSNNDARPFWTVAWLRMKHGFGEFFSG